MKAITKPEHFGAPPAFTEWYPQQDDAFFWGFESNTRHTGLGMSTGSGKMLVAYLLAKQYNELFHARTVILTSRIGLAHQYAENFPDIVEIHAKRNYRTPEEYQRQLARAQLARIVVTNYQFYFYSTISYRLGPNLSTVICDEAALAFREFSNFLSLDLNRQQLEDWGINWPGDYLSPEPQEWRVWAGERGLHAVEQVLKMRRNLDDEEEDTLRALAARLSIIKEMRGRWEIEQEEHMVRLGKVWPGEDAERYLFPETVRKVLYLSATLRPHSMELLGAPPSMSEFKEWPHPYPRHIRPVYWIPTIRAVETRASKEDWNYWVMRIDQIIRYYSSSLGLVHTVSYNRAKMVLERSDYTGAGLFVTHTPRNTLETVEWFRRQRGPRVLLSPVLVAGWDLPEVYYQIIGKIPWPDSRDMLIKARKEEDKTFAAYEAAQDLVQQAGRIVRGPKEEDKGISIIIDDSWEWFGPANKAAMPSWFYVERKDTLP